MKIEKQKIDVPEKHLFELVHFYLFCHWYAWNTLVLNFLLLPSELELTLLEGPD